jgi:iron complex transport system ATP-binding protein
MEKGVANYSQRELVLVVSFVSTKNIRAQNLKVFNLVTLDRYPHTGWFGTLLCEDKAKVLESIKMIGIQHLMWRNVSQLSDGEFQRAMIARTLAQDTPIIILDELTAFLDLPNKYEVLLLLRRLAREQAKTVISSTYDLGIAVRLVGKIWLMADEGLQQGASEDLALQGYYDKFLENTLLSFYHTNGGVDLGI